MGKPRKINKNLLAELRIFIVSNKVQKFMPSPSAHLCNSTGPESDFTSVHLKQWSYSGTKSEQSQNQVLLLLQYLYADRML